MFNYFFCETHFIILLHSALVLKSVSLQQSQNLHKCDISCEDLDLSSQHPKVGTPGSGKQRSRMKTYRTYLLFVLIHFMCLFYSADRVIAHYRFYHPCLYYGSRNEGGVAGPGRRQYTSL